MRTVLVILSLLSSVILAEEKKITAEQEKRYYRSLALISRIKEQAKAAEEAQVKELQKVIEEIRATGCSITETEKGLECKPEEKKDKK